jgi:acyl-CoA thioesterase I
MKGMNKSVKLLSAAVIVLIAVAGVQTYLLLNPNKPAQPEIRVACVGDSITRGTEYTLDLWAHLGSNYVIGDFGVGGTTVSLHSGSAYMNTTSFETAKEFQPDIVIVMLGTNDADKTLNETTQQFVNDYITLLDQFIDLPTKPDVYIMQPPPIYSTNNTLTQDLIVHRVQVGINQVSAQTGIPVIDAYTPLLGHPDLFLDGVHPKAEGAQLIADAVYTAVDWAAKPPKNTK